MQQTPRKHSDLAAKLLTSAAVALALTLSFASSPALADDNAANVPARKDYAAIVQTLRPVLRQNSMRTENSAIPCRDGCLIQVIPSPSDTKNLSRGTRAVYLYI
jgi:hypothetical protein